MLYIAASRCGWRLSPKCFPPVSTEASRSAGLIDRQSVKTMESGWIFSGFEAGKKVKGPLADTCGFLLFILAHTADIQDRDGTADVLAAVRSWSLSSTLYVFGQVQVQKMLFSAMWLRA